MPASRPVAERFWEKVIIPPDPWDCWMWTGGRQSRGYGMFDSTTAHHACWELVYGPVPDGLMVCHRCDVRLCVSPLHLFLGTAQDNTDDMMAKGRHRAERGEQAHASRLTEANVRAMRQESARGRSIAEVGRMFGVDGSTAWRAVHGITWQHVV